MIPRQIVLTDVDKQSVRMLGEWVRDVQEILTGNTLITDQIGGIHNITFNTGSSPVYVSTGYSSPPFGLRVLRANETGTNSMQSGNRVTWLWNDVGQLEISSIDGLTADTDYLITLQVLRGVS